MKEATARCRTRKVNEICWVREVREDLLDGQRVLSMTITDGRIQRKTLWLNTNEKVENVINTFKRINGMIYDEDLLLIDDINDVDYSSVEFERFFPCDQIPINVMFRYLNDISESLPSEIADLCFITVQKFKEFTCNRTVTESELNARIKATEEAFRTVVKWQRILQNKEIEKRDLVLAGIIIGSFMSFLENELLLQGWKMLPTKILICDFNHTAKEMKLDKETSYKIKKVIHAMYYRSPDEFMNSIVNNTFFKKN